MTRGRLLVQALVVTTAAAAAGCYDANAAIDASPLVPNDPHLIGTWRCVGPATTENAFTITAANDTARTYAITFQATGEQPEHMHAFTSAVKGATFLNVRDSGSGTSPWNIVRYVFLRPDVVEIRVVEETLFEKVAPTAVRATLERELNNPKLFDDRAPMVCVSASK
jgi:hypothetical protein